MRDHSALPIDSAAQPPPSRWRDLVGEGLLSATAGLCLVEMTAGLQTLLVATILPRAVRDIGGIQLYGLVFSGYMLAGIVSIPASGADADRHGPARPLFLYSGYFLVGTVLAALAPSMPLLVVARLIQGYGGGAMYSLAYGIVPRLYPAQLRPKMLALLSGVWGTSLLVAGAAVTAGAISWFRGSLWQEWVAERISVRRQALISCSVLPAAEVTVAAAIVGILLWLVFLGAIAEGLAMGVAFNLVLLMAMEPSGGHGVSTLTSTRFLVGRLGLVLGTGLAGVSVAAGSRGGAALTAGIAGARGVAIVGALVALLAAWRMARGPNSSPA